MLWHPTGVSINHPADILTESLPTHARAHKQWTQRCNCWPSHLTVGPQSELFSLTAPEPRTSASASPHSNNCGRFSQLSASASEGIEIKAPQPFSRWLFSLKKTWNFWCAILRALQRHYNGFSIKTSHIRLTWKHTVNQSIKKKRQNKKGLYLDCKRFQSCSVTRDICPCQPAAIRLHLKDVWRCRSEPTAEVNAMQCGLNADDNNQHFFLWHKPNDLHKPTHLPSLPSANVLSTTATMWWLNKTKTKQKHKYISVQSINLGGVLGVGTIYGNKVLSAFVVHAGNYRNTLGSHNYFSTSVKLCKSAVVLLMKFNHS